MAAMEKQLRENEASEGLEIDVANAMSGDKEAQEEKQQALPLRTNKKNTKPVTRQVLGNCKRCGYMSSQEICQACTLLEGLNKNRPQIRI